MTTEETTLLESLGTVLGARKEDETRAIGENIR